MGREPIKMGIAKYIGKKLIMLIPVLFGITVLAFLLGVLSPGDPVEAVLNPDGTQIVSDEEYAIMRERMGLDDPVPVQYVKWLKNALTGDLGRSFFTNKEIRDQLAYRLPYTIRLACFGMCLTVVFGLGFGILMARYRDKWPDRLLLPLITTLMLSGPRLLAGDPADPGFGRTAAPSANQRSQWFFLLYYAGDHGRVLHNRRVCSPDQNRSFGRAGPPVCDGRQR